jgi:hypothetical protein
MSSSLIVNENDLLRRIEVKLYSADLCRLIYIIDHLHKRILTIHMFFIPATDKIMINKYVSLKFNDIL